MIETTYTIQMASKLSGVGVHTIRAWEKRYKALEPSRDTSGHRTYSKTDVEKLILLSELCLLGYTISKVANLSISELKEQLKDLGKTEESLEHKDFNLVSEAKTVVDPNQSMPIIIFAFKNYKLDVVSLELSKLKALVSARDFALIVMLPLVRLLNESQASGVFTHLQCEVIKSTLKFHMGYGLFHVLDRRDKSPVNILVAGLQESSQDLTTGLMGLLCNHYGFQFTYVGTDLSLEALVELSRALEITTIMLSVGKGPLQSSIEKLISKMNPNVELVLLAKAELKSDFEPEKLSYKKLVSLKTVEALDSYLSMKK